MTFEKNEGIEYDDVKRNEFIAYIERAFKNVRLKYIAERKKHVTETMLDPNELTRLLDLQALDLDRMAAQSAGFSPASWDEIISTIENPKLDRILSQLTSDEQELLFYRLFHRLSYKEIGLRKCKCAKDVETRYDTVLRKLRRWWKG